MAAEPTIQTGTATVTSASNPNTATISAVTLANSFLLFTQEGQGDPDPRQCLIRGDIETTTTVSFETNTNPANDIEIRWWVLSFSSGVSVQAFNDDVGTNPRPNTLTAVTMAETFLLTNWMKGGTSFGSDDPATALLTSTTNVDVEVGKASASDHEYHLQVVEYTDASVQRSQTTFGSSDQSKSWTIGTGVTLDQSFPLFNFLTVSTMNSIDFGWRTRLTTTTNITSDRVGATGGGDMNWEVVELPAADVAIQHVTFDFAGTESPVQKDATLSPAVVVAKSTPMLSGYDGHWSAMTETTGTDDVQSIMARLEITSTTNVRATMYDQHDTDLAGVVIDWSQAAGPTLKSDSTTCAATVIGSVDALFSQSTKAGTVAASVVGSINAMFGDTQDTGTAAIGVVGSLNDLTVFLTTLAGTVAAAVVGSVDTISAVLLTTGSAAVSTVGTVDDLLGRSTQAGTVDVSVVGTVDDLFSQSTRAGTAAVTVVGSVDSIAAVLLTTGSAAVNAVGSVQLLDALMTLASTVDVAVVGSINEMFADTQATGTVAVGVTGSVSDLLVALQTQLGTADVAAVGSLASLIVAVSTAGGVQVTAVGTVDDLFSTLTTLVSSADVAVVGVVTDLLNQLPTVNSSVNVAVGGGGEVVDTGGGPADVPQRTYFFGYGAGFGS